MIRRNDDRSVSAQPDRHRDMQRTLLALYDEALPTVYGYFARRCADRGTAEDLTSETFLAAFQTAGAQRDDPPPIGVPWLLGVARHKLADHYRGRQDPVPVAEPPEPLGGADDWDTELDRLMAENVLAKLSEPHRAVLVLRYMDDCSVGECAELLGRTVHATEALLIRAKKAFRKEYPEGGSHE
ncbi:RNA polymerase sigma factor [Mycobacterium asiaticum]|uniref:RNA polymerase sigma factor n=2 Tax=Mycobacterium asiaticum TaxID=1790 RepID=UPI0009B81EFD